jgi:ssDNA-binding Zn-finger/Zn-ribbon topoisomerase 1
MTQVRMTEERFKALVPGDRVYYNGAWLTVDKWLEPDYMVQYVSGYNTKITDNWLVTMIVEKLVVQPTSQFFEFDCEHCHATTSMEMVSDGVIITEMVGDIVDIGTDSAQAEPNERAGYTIHDKNKTRYQCEICGHVVANNDNEFVDWLNSFPESYCIPSFSSQLAIQPASPQASHDFMQEDDIDPSKDKYIESLYEYYKEIKGTECPHCGSKEVEGYGTWEADGNWVAKKVCCSRCESRWEDVHTLTHMANFELGDGDATG